MCVFAPVYNHVIGSVEVVCCSYEILRNCLSCTSVLGLPIARYHLLQMVFLILLQSDDSIVLMV